MTPTAQAALDMTGDEWRAYDMGAAARRRQASVDPQAQERWQRAQQLARDAAQREGANEVRGASSAKQQA